MKQLTLNKNQAPGVNQHFLIAVGGKFYYS